jgi:hypothetical protein
MSLALALGLALVAVDVAGEVSCPAPTAVSRLVAQMTEQERLGRLRQALSLSGGSRLHVQGVSVCGAS